MHIFLFLLPFSRAGTSRPPALLLWPLLVLIAYLLASAVPLHAQAGVPARVSALAAGVAEDRIIIRLKPGKDPSLLHRQLGTKARKLLGRERNLNLEVVEKPRGSREKVLEAFRKSGLVEYAEPDFILEALVEPNDFR